MARILVGTEWVPDRWPVAAASQHTNEGRADRPPRSMPRFNARATREKFTRARTAERATHRLKNFHAPPAFEHVMAGIRVPGPLGRPRTTPDVVLGDKAHSSRAIRAHLRRARAVGASRCPDRWGGGRTKITTASATGPRRTATATAAPDGAAARCVLPPHLCPRFSSRLSLRTAAPGGAPATTVSRTGSERKDLCCGGKVEEDDETQSTMAAVGPRLKGLRTQRSLSLTALAEATGISLSTFSRLESGKRRSTLELLLPMARELRVDIGQLIGAPQTGDPRLHLQPVTAMV